jgi:hypothetical protein
MSEKEDILKELEEIPTEEITIGKTKVTVRALTCYDCAVWRAFHNSPDELVRTSNTAKLIQLSLYDKKGNRLFEDKEINELNGKFGKKIDDIVDVIQRVNGWSQAGQEAILKNLQRTLGVAGLRELQGNITVLLQNSEKDTATTS